MARRKRSQQTWRTADAGEDPLTKSQRQQGLYHAQAEFNQVYADSNLKDFVQDFPKFLPEELDLGKNLGVGSFGTVFEILGVNSDLADLSKHSIDLLNQHQEQLTSSKTMNVVQALGYEQADGKENRQFISKNCLREGTGESRYAVKLLKPAILSSLELLPGASYDLAVETRILANVMHPNIVKLRATGFSGLFHEQYFIVLDRLYQTLDRKIRKWANRQRRLDNPLLACLLDPSGEKRDEHWDKRLLIGYDLSAAIAYLHSKKIVWRDAKPENIGFDVRGDVKLFDFGLAAELKECYQSSGENDLYHLTGMTGTARYMSPEVGKGEPYNEKCDTYSFALLFFELMALERPYPNFTLEELQATVWNEPHVRPDLDELWPEEIVNILKLAWTNDLRKRLPMASVKEKLHKESLRVVGGDESRLEHQRRRSTNVFQPAVRRRRSRRGSSYSARTSGSTRRSSVARSSSNSRSSIGSLPSLQKLMFATSTVRDMKLDEEIHSNGDVQMLHRHGMALETMEEGSESQSSRLGSSRSLFSGLKDIDKTPHHSPQEKKRISVEGRLPECPEED